MGIFGIIVPAFPPVFVIIHTVGLRHCRKDPFSFLDSPHNRNEKSGRRSCCQKSIGSINARIHPVFSPTLKSQKQPCRSVNPGCRHKADGPGAPEKSVCRQVDVRIAAADIILPSLDTDMKQQKQARDSKGGEKQNPVSEKFRSASPDFAVPKS